jgi:cation-transporting P-type ATPase 13A2
MINDLIRDNVEKDLTFLGLIVLKNNLKAKTKDTIKTLSNSNIKSVMVTGDNLLTGINVAI